MKVVNSDKFIKSLLESSEYPELFNNPDQTESFMKHVALSRFLQTPLSDGVNLFR